LNLGSKVKHKSYKEQENNSVDSQQYLECLLLILLLRAKKLFYCFVAVLQQIYAVSQGKL
jgi:hypothetical protein